MTDVTISAISTCFIISVTSAFSVSCIKLTITASKNFNNTQCSMALNCKNMVDIVMDAIKIGDTFAANEFEMQDKCSKK